MRPFFPRRPSHGPMPPTLDPVPAAVRDAQRSFDAADRAFWQGLRDVIYEEVEALLASYMRPLVPYDQEADRPEPEPPEQPEPEVSEP